MICTYFLRHVGKMRLRDLVVVVVVARMVAYYLLPLPPPQPPLPLTLIDTTKTKNNNRGSKNTTIFAHILLLTNILTMMISKMRFFKDYLKLTITSKQKQLKRSNCARMKALENIFPTVSYFLHFAAFLTEL